MLEVYGATRGRATRSRSIIYSGKTFFSTSTNEWPAKNGLKITGLEQQTATRLATVLIQPNASSGALPPTPEV